MVNKDNQCVEGTYVIILTFEDINLGQNSRGLNRRLSRVAEDKAGLVVAVLLDHAGQPANDEYPALGTFLQLAMLGIRIIMFLIPMQLCIEIASW